MSLLTYCSITYAIIGCTNYRLNWCILNIDVTAAFTNIIIEGQILLLRVIILVMTDVINAFKDVLNEVL